MEIVCLNERASRAEARSFLRRRDDRGRGEFDTLISGNRFRTTAPCENRQNVTAVRAEFGQS